MCETLAGSPVNTGEQPPPETAPSVTQTNGESRPHPDRKYKDYVYRKMLVQEYLKK